MTAIPTPLNSVAGKPYWSRVDLSIAHTLFPVFDPVLNKTIPVNAAEIRKIVGWLGRPSESVVSSLTLTNHYKGCFVSINTVDPITITIPAASGPLNSIDDIIFFNNAGAVVTITTTGATIVLGSGNMKFTGEMVHMRQVKSGFFIFNNIYTTAPATRQSVGSTASNYAISPLVGNVHVVTLTGTGQVISAGAGTFSDALKDVSVVLKGSGLATATYSGITWAGINSAGDPPDPTGMDEVHFTLAYMGTTVYGYQFGEVASA